MMSPLSAAEVATKLTGPPKPRCRAIGCTERLDPDLVDREDNTGLHLLCEEPADAPSNVDVDNHPYEVYPDIPHCRHCLGHDYDPQHNRRLPVPASPPAPAGPVPGPPPPSTVAELRDLLIAHEAGSARSVQKMIGPSEIGVPCQRALGYKLLNTPEQPDPRVPWAPILGTALHAYIADVLAAHNAALGRQRWIIEERVWPDDMISGSGDAFDLDTGTVIDWKLVGDSSITKYRKAMRPEYQAQAHLYGLGHERAGRTVRHVRIVCLHRSHEYDKAWEWTEPYDRNLAQRALQRVYDTVVLLSELGVEQTPALWGAVPATYGKDCRWCRFFRPARPADDTGCPGDPNSWP